MSDAGHHVDDGPLSLPFGRHALIGMVHLRPLPGTPRWSTDADSSAAIDAMVSAAVRDAAALAEAGFDAVIVENMNDAPYLKRRVGAEIVAAMAVATARVVDAVSIPVGVQVLAGDNASAIAIALATGAGFIRAEGFVFAATADEGILDEADAGPLLRFRRAIGAAHVPVLADIRKKHTSHALTADLAVGDWAHAAAFSGADGVIVTGAVTGAPTDIVDLDAARRAGPLPVGVGSGVTVASVSALLRNADFAIVGTAIKRDGDWRLPVDPRRAAELVETARRDVPAPAARTDRA